ncbi:MAG: hypothetical protein DI532_21855 [Azospirillum brasilense]|jgi:enhancing lycopene biosynthesis protein 2|nr:MAG: hypothetical protein DI532_21855 [Azospirillum brasilense]
MSTSLAFLSQTATEAGEVAVDHLSGLLHITRSELAHAARLSRGAIKALPSFGDQTAEALVKEGRAEAVKRYLNRIAADGDA